MCAICGGMEAREWRPCPKEDGKLICGSTHCMVCSFWRKPEDAGTLWCTYRHGKKEPENKVIKVRRLTKKVEELEKKVRFYYSHNWPSKARLAERELVLAVAELRRAKNE